MWSFKEEDPPNGADGTFIAHDFKGSASVNLLGGLLNRPDIPDTTDYFEVLASDVCTLILLMQNELICCIGRNSGIRNNILVLQFHIARSYTKPRKICHKSM